MLRLTFLLVFAALILLARSAPVLAFGGGGGHAGGFAGHGGGFDHHGFNHDHDGHDHHHFFHNHLFFGGFGGFGYYDGFWPYAYDPYYYPYYYPPAVVYPAAATEVTIMPGAAGAANNCHEFRTTVTIDGKRQPAVGTVCRQADGSWRIAH
jgi:hypothetical protein